MVDTLFLCLPSLYHFRYISVSVLFLFRQRPTFPGSFPPSIIGTTELNFRVRDGNGCDLCVITTEYFVCITFVRAHSKLNNASHFKTLQLTFVLISQSFRSSPRSISIAQLNTLLHLHLRPINDVVFIGPYQKVGYLILRWASRLDAFSVYPFRTWLPSRAIGMTTGAPLVRPSRSSRTKDSSSQISCAHDR